MNPHVSFNTKMAVCVLSGSSISVCITHHPTYTMSLTNLWMAIKTCRLKGLWVPVSKSTAKDKHNEIVLLQLCRLPVQI